MKCVKCATETLRKNSHYPICYDCTKTIYDERDQWKEHILSVGFEKKATKSQVKLMKDKINTQFILNLYSMGVNVTEQLVNMKVKQEERIKAETQKDNEKIAEEHDHRGLDKDE